MSVKLHNISECSAYQPARCQSNMESRRSQYRGSMLSNCDNSSQEHLIDNDTLDQHYQQRIRNSLNTDMDNNDITSGVNDASSNFSQDSSKLFKESKLQGVVFLEDAINYRSIHHKADLFSLKLYQWYHSAAVKCSVVVATFLILMLAFIEDPSSLSWSSDPRRLESRYIFPDGFTEGIEIVCLLILTMSGLIQGYLSTNQNKTKASFFKKNPWLTGGYIVLVLSFVDVIVSLVLGNHVYRIRVRRLFRPYFLAQNTTMLKKTLKAMWNTVPEIASVLTLLSLHLYFFTMLGMLVFHKTTVNGTTYGQDDVFNNTEWKLYFSTVDTALMSLIVLLTTANNPDVMMPSYSENRLYAIYFIVFSLVGTFLVFNLLTAIIYNQFRGYFKSSMQTSYFRRCVALSAAFHALSKTSILEENSEEVEEATVRLSVIKEVVNGASVTPDQKRLILVAIREETDIGTTAMNLQRFCQLFHNIDSTCRTLLPPRNVPIWSNEVMRFIQKIVLNRYFNLVGNLVVLLNAIMMTVEIAIHYEQAFQRVFSRLNIMNYIFVGYYCIEQVLKVLSMGKRYFVNFNCLYDGLITMALLCLEIVQLATYGNNSTTNANFALSLWDCARIVNILVLIRLLRIIPNFKPMALVTGVMLEIIRSLKSFAGVIIIIYYVFAIIGMMAFEKQLDPPPGNVTKVYRCGTYQQLQYWANNFDDFAASLVVLWDVMVVNNWGVFLQTFKTEVNPWSQMYFVAWWLISSVVCINLFIALILDHFIAKWEGDLNERDTGRRGTIQSLFRKHLREPSQARINEELMKHPSLYQETDPQCSS